MNKIISLGFVCTCTFGIAFFGIVLFIIVTYAFNVITYNTN